MIAHRAKTKRVYSTPTAFEIAGLIVGDLDQLSNKRDIVVEHKSSGFQPMGILHPLYMSMQYPLFFPHGEDGYTIDIKYQSQGRRKQVQRQCVTMQEYFAYEIQIRLNKKSTLLRGWKLFHQFLVDAFATVEGDRLDYIKVNQKQMRSDLFQGFRDAVCRGDIEADNIGKRIILVTSFTVSP